MVTELTNRIKMHAGSKFQNLFTMPKFECERRLPGEPHPPFST